mgnify:CR=1 FL=1
MLQFLTDHELFKRIAVMLLVDAVILVPWTVFHPMKTHQMTIQTKVCTVSHIVLFVKIKD